MMMTMMTMMTRHDMTSTGVHPWPSWTVRLSCLSSVCPSCLAVIIHPRPSTVHGPSSAVVRSRSPRQVSTYRSIAAARHPAIIVHRRPTMVDRSSVTVSGHHRPSTANDGGKPWTNATLISRGVL